MIERGKAGVHDQELRGLTVGVHPADRYAGTRRARHSRAAPTATGCSRWPATPEATIREVMSACSRMRPSSRNCQPSSRTMVPRAMPENSALRSRAQFKKPCAWRCRRRPAAAGARSC